MTSSPFKSRGWKHHHPATFNFHRRRHAFKARHAPGNLLKNILLLAVVCFLLGTLAILGLFASISQTLPNPDVLTERNINQTTRIYDRTGEHLLYEIFGEENRTLAKMQEGFCKDDPAFATDDKGIPLYAVQATITAEDRAFCSHYGFSIRGILRALIYRGSRGGGSTLTQQLVKNAILSNEKTLTRKAKELILSLELERKYSKDEILQIYFNEIPYGSTNYGIQAAAESYFDKSASGLTVAEAATLAALPRAPTAYINNPDMLKNRRDWIIDNMVSQNFLTKEEAETAKKEDTTLHVRTTNIRAPHFVFYVKEKLEEMFNQRQVEEGGLKVITSLDFDKQTIAEEEITKVVESSGPTYNFSNAALVAIDPKTGQVLAMVGSKDYFDDAIDGQVNVTLRPRQPGSSFKPIVYAKAFEIGYTPNTVLWDVKTDFPSPVGVYSPNNYDLKERGPLRLRAALQGSLNIPAVEMLYMVGVSNALDFAEQLGYSTFGNRSNFGLAIVLGGGEVKLLEHVAAYGIFANEGVKQETAPILRVEDAKGNLLYEWKQKNGQEVMKRNTALMLSNVLSDNAARAYVFGTNNQLTLRDRPVAAKTGTTNDYHDAWTMGYVPSLAAGVWAGNNNNDEMKRGGGSSVAAPIWNAFMQRALAATPAEAFPTPEIPHTGKMILDGALQHADIMMDKASGKRATEYTPASYRVAYEYAEYHSLLHYINRSDPLGPVPTNPNEDPYYQFWETAIANWLMKREAETGVPVIKTLPPEEYDDLHIPTNFPSINITQPNDGLDLNTDNLFMEVMAAANRGVARVEFYLDGYFLGLDREAPYILNATLPNTLPRGYHTLKAVAFDDIDNSASDTISLRTLIDPLSLDFGLLDPKNSQTIVRTEDTYQLVVSLPNPNNYRLLSVYAQKIDTTDRLLAAQKISPDSAFTPLTWNLPSSGDWILYVTATSKTSEANLHAPGILVHIQPKENTGPDLLNN